MRITHSQKTTIQLLSLLFLPGVIVHELAHWFVASILFVKTGEIEFFPQIQGNVVKLGSVAVASTDPIRRFLIGVAPLFIGVGGLLLLFFFLAPATLTFTWQTVLLIYASFEIGNTMFSSKKDMEGALGLGIVSLGVFIILYFLGIRVPATNVIALFTPQVIAFFKSTSFIVSIPLVINFMMYVLIRTIFLRR